MPTENISHAESKNEEDVTRYNDVAVPETDHKMMNGANFDKTMDVATTPGTNTGITQEVEKIRVGAVVDQNDSKKVRIGF